MTISWKNIIAGDREAYSKAYLLFYDRFYNYGLKFTTDIPVVEDSIQEVLMIIWRDRDRLISIDNPEGYFFSSFRNHLFRKIKEGAKQTAMAVTGSEPEFSRDTILINQEIDASLTKRLQKSLDSLSPRQREAIFLRFYEGLPFEEVAKLLGISTKGTYKLMARALEELKTKMHLPATILLTLLLRQT